MFFANTAVLLVGGCKHKHMPAYPSTSEIAASCLVLIIINSRPYVIPFRTAVPFGDKTTWNLAGLSPERDCGSKSYGGTTFWLFHRHLRSMVPEDRGVYTSYGDQSWSTKFSRWENPTKRGLLPLATIYPWDSGEQQYSITSSLLPRFFVPQICTIIHPIGLYTRTTRTICTMTYTLPSATNEKNTYQVKYLKYGRTGTIYFYRRTAVAQPFTLWVEKWLSGR